jgi:hypothetical protein
MGEYFAYGMDLQVADGYWIQVANYTKIVVSWMSKGSRQRPTAPTYWDNHEKVFYSKDDLLNKPKRKQAMNVLDDVEISSEDLRRLYEYFTDPAHGFSTVGYISKITGVPEKEVKAFCVVFSTGEV